MEIIWGSAIQHQIVLQDSHQATLYNTQKIEELNFFHKKKFLILMNVSNAWYKEITIALTAHSANVATQQ